MDNTAWRTGLETCIFGVECRFCRKCMCSSKSKTVQLATLAHTSDRSNGAKCKPQSSPLVTPEVQQYTGIIIINFQGCMTFLPAGRAQSTRPAAPKITLQFPHLYVYIYICIYVCASALITCAIITSRTSLPCDLTLVDFFA